MDPDNYGSRETCQRLADAGIVLETEVCWSPIFDFDMSSESGMPIPIKDWELLHREHINASMWALKAIPAPSMAEVWRELPNGITIRKLAGQMWVWIDTNEDSVQHNTNPTDALIDLRIWLEERKEET